MIHVCYAFTDQKGTYCQLVGASIASLLSNTEQAVTVHIIHDNTLSHKNHDNFRVLAEKFHANFIYYDIYSICGEYLAAIRKEIQSVLNVRLTIGALYRLLIPRILELERVIYLDGDTIVNLDISALWNEDLDNYAIGAVAEKDATCGHSMPQHLTELGITTEDTYFCSGVLLLDILKLREQGDIIGKGIAFLKEHPKCFLMDQDILNYFFSGSYKHLNAIYDIFVGPQKRFRRAGKLDNTIMPGIFHYAGSELSVFPAYDISNILWIYFLSMTPWFTHDFYSKTLMAVNRKIEDNHVIMADFISTILTTQPVFVYSEDYISQDTIRENYPFVKDFKFVKFENIEAVLKLVNCIIVCFVLPNEYTNIRIALMQTGRTEGRDFINGLLLFKDNAFINEFYLIQYGK